MNDFITLTGRIDRRSPDKRGDKNNPVKRENLLSRNGKLTKIPGTRQFGAEAHTSEFTWLGRYYSDETGVADKTTLGYTQDGRLWRLDENNQTFLDSQIKDGLNEDAYPKHAFFKVGNQTYMYFVDGKNLYKWNGNLDYRFDEVDLKDADGNSVNPIDLMEFNDRLCVISEKKLYISANLAPDEYDDPDDSLEVVVGSGRGINRAIGRIEDNLFILTNEGIFGVFGDVISAVANTWEVRRVDDKRCISGRSACSVERSIMFVADDYELYSFNGESSKMISYPENLALDMSPVRDYLDKMVAHYDRFKKYYMLSFVENGKTYNNLEIFFDALEEKIDFVRGRNVSCYTNSDTNKEEYFAMIGRSDKGEIDYAWSERNFDGEAIPILLRSRQIVPSLGENVRFTAFYPEFECTAQRDVFMRYLLDGRISDIPTGGIDNVLLNSAFNDWTAGAPDNWSRVGITGGVAAESTIEKYYGRAAMRITGTAFPGGTLYRQSFSVTDHIGKELRFTCYVFTRTASNSRIGIFSGGKSNISSFHPGDGVWTRLQCSIRVPSGATTAGVFCENGTADGWFDGAVCEVRPIEQANFRQDVSGEAKTLGLIRIANQSQAIDRVRPKIKYSKGESIAFEISEQQTDLDFVLTGIGMDYVPKGRKKSKKVGA